MKKSENINKTNTQELLKDINLILNNLNSLDFLELDKDNIDKISSNIIKNTKNLEEKYQQYLPKKDLDPEK
jgi:hypothetical protein